MIKGDNWFRHLKVLLSCGKALQDILQSKSREKKKKTASNGKSVNRGIISSSRVLEEKITT